MKGSANNSRKNAVAVGPVWLSRTRIGANPMPVAPANNAMNAQRSFAENLATILEFQKPGRPTRSTPVNSPFTRC
jgi:hypothetical protein